MKLLFTIAFISCATLGMAQQIQLAPGETLVAINGVPVTQQRATTSTQKQAGLLHWKAARMAREGRCRHVGGGYLPGARAEGVGMSSSSPQAAVRNCCYYGRRPLVGSAVARGRGGWYAVNQYR